MEETQCAIIVVVVVERVGGLHQLDLKTWTWTATRMSRPDEIGWIAYLTRALLRFWPGDPRNTSTCTAPKDDDPHGY